MFDCLNALIQKEIMRVENHPARALLSDQALTRFSDALRGMVNMVSESTVTHLIAQEVAGENPFATLAPELIAKDQRESAEKALNERLNTGEMCLPEPMMDILRLRLSNVTDGFAEMLSRLAEHREELSRLLPEGRAYTRIEDIEFSAGDTHNHGRSVTILITDAGKLVYKPRDMRGDAGILALAKQFFSDVLGIPECAAFGDRFGVSEFIEKRRAEGAGNASRFWYNMGGAAAVIKLLGSVDMHVENLSCRDDKPYILDLETVLSPEVANHTYEKLHPELWKLKTTSPYLSCLMPNSPKGREYSVLMNTGEEGCAPLVEGKRVSAVRYMREFSEGYTAVYRRILENRGEIRSFISEFAPTMPVRLLLRNTQFYHDTIIKLYHHRSLESAASWQENCERLKRIMTHSICPDFAEAVESEAAQMLRGGIPYVYTYANADRLYSDGVPVTKSVFSTTAEQHILDNLDAMSPEDLTFDLALFDRCVTQYPVPLAEQERPAVIPLIRPESPLSPDESMAEAKKMFDLTFDLSLKGPDGKLYWGYINEGDYSFRFCEMGLTNALTGIAAFAAAYARASGDPRAEEKAERAVKEAVTELERMYAYLEESGFVWESAPYLGESDGIGGILTGLALIRRYTGSGAIQALQEKTLYLLSCYDLSRYGAPDRMVGMAGLLSALCRYPEYMEHTDLIRAAADSLMAMKKLDHHGRMLWKPLPDKDRPISGAGHGLAGIAEALYAAAGRLRDDRYALAAADAMAFERETYNERFGTWSDLRSYPPVGYMHGYCSGAPGIGLMAEHIRKAGYDGGDIAACAELAKASVETLPLNLRDHLCCGNSAIVEYLLAAGRRDEAGRVLQAMRKRSEKTGEYRYMSYDFHNGATASLFYGAGGIGYEMLRYACPETILPVI